jgi:hypothetical protein
MHAKQSRLGLRFFAHDHVSPECSLNGETAQHRYLKGALAEIVRSQSGWEATIEAASGDADQSDWRADVLAVRTTTGRRVAFEVQLAPMTAAVGAERAAQYAADGVESVWLCDLRRPSWLGHIPAIIMNHKRTELLSIPNERLRVAFGVVVWERGQPEWLESDFKNHTAPLLADVVTGILERQYRPRQLYGATVLAGAGEAVCRQRALIDRPCRERVATKPCALHGSPPAIRALRKSAGLSAWGWDEGRFWRDWQSDTDKREMRRRSY